MGAELWYHQAPWADNPADALKLLQASYVSANYDLATLLPQLLEWAKESVAAAKAGGASFDLVEMHEEEANVLEEFCREPIPADVEAQIGIIRRINANSGEGIGNVLDIRGISENRDVHRTQRLGDDEILRLVGSPKPSISQADKAIPKINRELDRGESVCFPVYENEQPVGWYFVGNTID
jgi:hypothetical protein